MKLKVLIVDDSKTVRFHENSMLKDLEFEIDEAEDGIEALAKARLNPPDLVLMDIMMPRLDGIGCCRRFKSDELLKHAKVIMVTSKEDFKKVDEAFKAGCDDYIVKPIQREELMQKIDDLANLIRAMRQLRL